MRWESPLFTMNSEFPTSITAEGEIWLSHKQDCPLGEGSCWLFRIGLEVRVSPRSFGFITGSMHGINYSGYGNFTSF